MLRNLGFLNLGGFVGLWEFGYMGFEISDSLGFESSVWGDLGIWDFVIL